MDTNPLFTAALGLIPPWAVIHTSFDVAGKRLTLQVDFPAESRFVCPSCEAADCPVYDSTEKQWRHLDFFQHQAYITARVPRVSCKRCGVKQVEVPWARSGSGFTLLMEALILELSRHMPVKPISDLIGVDDKRIWRVIEHYVEKAVEQMDCSTVREIGVDETSARKRHDYITVFYDLIQRRLLFIADGKDAETVGKFADFLDKHSANAAQIREVSSDMSPAFIKGITEHLPNAEITFDKFHIAKILSAAVDAVRRIEWRKDKIVKGARYAVLKNAENLTDRERTLLAEVTARNQPLAEAYRLKETFRDFYQQTDQGAAHGFLRAWVIMALRSKIPPMIEAANTIRRRWKGIMRWFRTRITNAVMEGLNSLLQAAKRKARGYRTHHNFRLIAYLIAGKLDFHLPTLR
jgi:transposase